MTKVGQFRNTTWDPLLIISQIIALQCVMYVGLGLWTVFLDLLVGSSRSLDHLFKYQVTFDAYHAPQLLRFHLLQENCCL
jgi:hypothetical protein